MEKQTDRLPLKLRFYSTCSVKKTLLLLLPVMVTPCALERTPRRWTNGRIQRMWQPRWARGDYFGTAFTLVLFMVCITTSIPWMSTWTIIWTSLQICAHCRTGASSWFTTRLFFPLIHRQTAASIFNTFRILGLCNNVIIHVFHFSNIWYSHAIFALWIDFTSINHIRRPNNIPYHCCI